MRNKGYNRVMQRNVGACHGLCENRINRAKNAPIPSPTPEPGGIRRPLMTGVEQSRFPAVGMS